MTVIFNYFRFDAGISRDIGAIIVRITNYVLPFICQDGRGLKCANIHLFCCCRMKPVGCIPVGKVESGDGLGLIGSVGYIEHYWPVKSQAIASGHNEWTTSCADRGLNIQLIN